MLRPDSTLCPKARAALAMWVSVSEILVPASVLLSTTTGTALPSRCYALAGVAVCLVVPEVIRHIVTACCSCSYAAVRVTGCFQPACLLVTLTLRCIAVHILDTVHLLDGPHGV
jgi:hypothetical protein